LLAGLLIAMTMCFAACSGTENGKTNGSIVTGTTVGEYKDGIHEINYEVTNELWVENGQSEYKIVIPEQTTDMYDLAAEELSDLLYEATGAKLSIIKDSECASFTGDSKIISLGDTRQADQAGVVEGKELDKYGYIIKTVGKSIFIEGNTDIAVSNGVYGFLEEEVAFDCFTRDTYYVEKTKNLSFKKYAVRDVPDIKIMDAGTPYGKGKPKVTRRFRAVDRGEFVAGEVSVHSAFKYLPPSIYDNPDGENYHPKWYSDDRTQICYTAHGDETEFNALKRKVADLAIAEFKKDIDRTMFIFSQEDKITWCECDTCSASLNKYGANSAVVIQFCNQVASLINEWMATEEGIPYARDYDILYLSYNLTVDAPVVYNEETGEYAPVDDSVVCAPHTCVMFAPIEMDYQHSLYAPCNKKFLTAFLGWRVLSPKFNFYTYSTNYNYNMYPFECFNTYRELYRFAAESNTHFFFDHQQTGQEAGSTGWLVLKNYIASKIYWNVNRNMEGLIEKFFAYTYGEGAEEVYTVFKEFRTLWQKNLVKSCRTLSVYGIINKPEYWPLETLRRWDGLFDEAIEKISYWKKADPDKYERLYKEITTERIAYEYILVDLYETQLDPNDALKWKLQVKEDCARTGITIVDSDKGETLAQVLTRWGV